MRLLLANGVIFLFILGLFLSTANPAQAEVPQAQVWRKLQIPADKIASFYYTNIADINADGQKEFVFSKSAGLISRERYHFYLAAFDLNGTLLWEIYQPGNHQNINTFSKGTWQVGNMNQDPYLEIASLWQIDGVFKLRIISGKDGQVIAEKNVGERRARRLSIGDLQGRLFKGEIALSDSLAKKIHIYSLDGNQLTYLCSTEEFSHVTGNFPVFYDVDNNGKEEIFNFNALYGNQCQKLWKAPSSNEADSTFIGEIDANSNNGPEILTVRENAGVWRYNSRGQKVWSEDFGGDYHLQNFRVANILGTATPELIINIKGGGGEDFIMDLNGQLLKRFGPGRAYPVNWEGKPQVILYFRSTEEFYNGKGQQLNILPADAGPRDLWLHSSNLQGDIREEIITAGEDGRIWIYQNPEPPTCPLYGQEKDWTNRSTYYSELNLANMREFPCDGSPPSPTPTGTLSPTPTLTPIPTSQPSVTPSLTPVLSPTPTSGSCLDGNKGNLDCDSTALINVIDLTILLNKWNPAGPVPTPNPNQAKADLNNDAKVDEIDLTILLSNWKTQ